MAKKISTIAFGKLNNAEIDYFFSQILLFISEYTIEKLNLTQQLVDALRNCQAILMDLVKRQLASALSPQLAALDEERDGYVSYLFSALKTATKSPVAAQRTAAAEVEPVVRPYKGIERHAVGQKSSEIVGLLHDLSREDLGTHLNALRLTDVIEALDTANTQYITLDAQRTAEIPSKAETDKARRATAAAYFDITDRLEASFILQPTPEIEALIVKINNMVKYTEDAYNTRIGMLHANKRRKEEAEKEKK